MHNSLAKVLDLIKMMVSFALLTLLFYFLINWVAGILDHQGLDKEPSGKSVQVVERIPEETKESINEVTRRLVFFYWYGE